MSTISPLERIQKKVQARLNKEFVPHLIEEAVNYHTRQRMRPGCVCSYCEMKRWATSYVGTTKMNEVKKYVTTAYIYLDEMGNAYHRFWESGVYVDEDEISEAVKKNREAKRKEVRSELNAEKQIIL